jgi:hypothetical protein
LVNIMKRVYTRRWLEVVASSFDISSPALQTQAA